MAGSWCNATAKRTHGQDWLFEESVSGGFEHLDRLLRQLLQVLEAPGDDGGESAEQRLDLLYESMGAEALEAMLRRQGMDRSSIEETLAVMTRRRRLMS